ncbi:MAG: GTP 3',8-cyclase MoaA [Blautia hansenii]
MKDSYGRTVDYMRISITDRCNLRCRYCMPEMPCFLPRKELLSLEEILDICVCGARMGIRKIKITGGEPLLRPGCVELIRKLKEIPGMEKVTLTTNGVLLAPFAEALYQAGIDGVNVSLDTLNEETYRKITGFDKLAQVLEGLDTMSRFPVPLKTNTVLLPWENGKDWKELALLAKNRRIDVRFIEKMPLGKDKETEGVSNILLLEEMQASFGKAEPDGRSHGNGPAVYYRFPGFQEVWALSAPYMIISVQGCNRSRMTAEGKVKPCLCRENFSLKEQ